jgi:catechol 2,3-dioxygenase-like lactoylglutathione lyase family enzyme
MIRGGMPTLYVSDLDRSVRFYIEALGLGLVFRAGDHGGRQAIASFTDPDGNPLYLYEPGR